VKHFLKKLQKLPESKRKAILWSVIIILSLVLFSWWFKNFNQKMKNFQQEKFIKELNLPELPYEQ